MRRSGAVGLAVAVVVAAGGIRRLRRGPVSVAPPVPPPAPAEEKAGARSSVVRRVTAWGIAGGMLAAVLGAGYEAWTTGGTARWAWIGGASVGAAALLLWWLLVPATRWLSGERHALTSAERDTLTVPQRLEAVGNARSALMQSVTGLVVIVGVVFTAAGLIYTSKTLDVSRQGQDTDRYAKAVEELGSEKVEVRLGGIYALQRLAEDSDRDRTTIVRVLAAYARTHAQDPPSGTDRTRPAIDTDAALTVGGRLAQEGTGSFDLTSIDLHHRALKFHTLAFADLSGANLTDADLSGADLSGVILYNANLTRTALTGAHLSGAYLGSANLTGASLFEADLSQAFLPGAKLINAFLTRANLTGTELRDAELTGADLTGADLRGSDLTVGEARKRGARVDG